MGGVHFHLHPASCTTFCPVQRDPLPTQHGAAGAACRQGKGVCGVVSPERTVGERSSTRVVRCQAQGGEKGEEPKQPQVLPGTHELRGLGAVPAELQVEHNLHRPVAGMCRWSVPAKAITVPYQADLSDMKISNLK
jgi:hypothetical protein